jgi:hypothetical protein
VNGQTQEALATEYGVSKVRIGQIIKSGGLTKKDRGLRPDVRSCKLTILVKPGVKMAIENLSTIDEKPISRWISDIIEQELTNRQISFAGPMEEHLRLPLEG